MITFKNQKGYLSITGSTVVIIGFILFCLLGWLLFGGGSNDQVADSDATKVSKVTTPTNINSGQSDAKSIQISALNLKINDPEGRMLIAETINMPSSSGTTSTTAVPGTYVRDSNKDFYNRCQYPVRISDVTSMYSGSTAPSEFTKKINDKSYLVGIGSNESKKCGNSKPEDESYIINLRQYILTNLLSS